MKIDQSTLIQRNQQSITETKLADEMMILHVEEGEYHHLNASGAELWDWLKEPQTVASLAQKLAEKYACSPAQCQDDVLSWLQDASEKQLLQIISSPEDEAFKMDYLPPKTESFNALKVIQGNNNQFQTDNFNTGS